MREKYYFLGAIVLLCVVILSSQFNVFSNVNNNSNLLTGNVVDEFGIETDYFIAGDKSACFIYNNSVCPVNTTGILSVGNEVLNASGAHVGLYNNSFFPYKLCCRYVLNYTGAGGYIFTGDTINETGGSHLFPDNVSFINSSLVGYPEMIDAFGDITYTEKPFWSSGLCPQDSTCMLKVSQFSTDPAENFSNTHVWDCSVDPAGSYTNSICYTQRNFSEVCSNNYAGGASCSDTNSIAFAHFFADSRWMFCSYGEDDVKTDNETGHCCPFGEYWSIEDGFCVDSNNVICGFDNESTCNITNTNNNTRPDNYLGNEYFNKVFENDENNWCVNYATMESCCYRIRKYETYGNFKCPIDILIE